MDKKELNEMIEEHEKWLDYDGGERLELIDEDLRHSNLRDSDLRDSDLRGSDLRHSDLRDSDLRHSNLRGSDLRDSNLRDSDLRDSDLRGSNLSGSEGLLNQIEWLQNNLEEANEGYIAYKQFGNHYEAPDDWEIEPGEVLEEVVNSVRTQGCGCGVNVAVEGWDEFQDKETWQVLIRYEWLAGVVVPYNTNGKFRCSRVELVEKV